jgi:hypothetical protein
MMVLKDVVKAHVDAIIHRPIGSVGELHVVKEGVGGGFEMGQNQMFKVFHDDKVGAKGL